MTKKLLDFQASITDVKQINPLFSTCKVRTLYTGKNRNMSIISKDAVEKALPTLANIPIVGEFSEENKDFKGHGGAIDLDSYKYIHTTKPYGVVPESATYEWEQVKGADGSIREYLVINGCYLWTGRYEEAYSVIENGKGQSMEIEVTDGRWDEEQEAYQIDNFVFSALCILGDDVEPAFEDANITAYSLDKDSFKQEFSRMMSELKSSIEETKEVNKMLKDLLKKYSTTIEELTAKGLNFSEISEDELETRIVEVLEVTKEKENGDAELEATEPESTKENVENTNEEPEVAESENTEPEVIEPVEPEATEPQVDVTELQDRITQLETELTEKDVELNSLREFKLQVEKAEHENKVQAIFANFQLTEEDVKDINIHEFSVEEIEEKCYAILGRKLATNKKFSLENEGNGTVKIPVVNSKKEEETPSPYGGLFEQYKDKK